MNVLTQLGVNQTLWIQLVLFLVAYVFLSQFLFKPYLRVIHARKKNTGGAVGEASEISATADYLVVTYQQKVKQQHDEASNLYQKIKSEGLRQEETILSDARSRAAQLVEQTKKEIHMEFAKTQAELRDKVPGLSSLIASHLLGRDV